MESEEELVCGAYKKLTINDNNEAHSLQSVQKNRTIKQTNDNFKPTIKQPNEQKEDYGQETDDSDNDILVQNYNMKCKTNKENIRLLNRVDRLESENYEKLTRHSKENIKPEKLLHTLSMPKINATSHLMKDMHTLKNIKLPKIEKLDDLTPVSKAKIASKITRKLNFKPNEQIFKNLISLNVSEIEEPLHKHKVNIKHVNNNIQVLEPNLSYYLDPLPPLSPVKPFPATRQRKTEEQNRKQLACMELPGALELYRRIFEKEEETNVCTLSNHE
ncbi:uncharacterized protein LOC119685881 [Teleopsis dalmanni]|uniref:uncharacterized protein LOC119685881 n=1 Tax=Teleopsis dalmanni TaxID=139649 RepID=UPI0018CCC6B8|nr:uncharacterized protein LOC119685881 [Teleopsis dalmanni]